MNYLDEDVKEELKNNPLYRRNIRDILEFALVEYNTDEWIKLIEKLLAELGSKPK